MKYFKVLMCMTIIALLLCFSSTRTVKADTLTAANGETLEVNIKNGEFKLNEYITKDSFTFGNVITTKYFGEKEITNITVESTYARKNTYVNIDVTYLYNADTRRVSFSYNVPVSEESDIICNLPDTIIINYGSCANLDDYEDPFTNTLGELLECNPLASEIFTQKHYNVGFYTTSLYFEVGYPDTDNITSAKFKRVVEVLPSTWVTKVTTKSITMKANSACEYSIDGGETWKESCYFGNLKSKTTYTITIRAKATKYYGVGTAVTKEVTTK